MVASADLISYANTLKGKPYVFGAAGPSSFDCSGLMQYVFKHFGISLPRTTYEQVKQGIPVTRAVSAMKPGDLVFSSWDGTPNSHVGMYIGGGSIINAPRSGVPVGLASLNGTYMDHVTAVRRIPGVDGQTGPTGAEANMAGAIRQGADALAGGLGAVDSNAGIISAIQGAAGALGDMAGSLGSAGKFADQLMKLALPTNITRAVAGVFGVGFVLVGITFLVRQVRA